MVQSIVTIAIFFFINFGLWEILVSNGISQEWASFIVYAVLFILVILIWHKNLTKDWNRLREDVKSWKKFFCNLLIWIVTSFALAYLFQFLVSKNFITTNTENMGKVASSIPPILSCIMMTIFGPVIEEITFRQSMIGFVPKHRKVFLIVMMIISVIIFDCIHLYRWQEFFYYLPLSIALTTFYVKYNKNIYSSIFMHSLLNLPGAILLIIGVI